MHSMQKLELKSKCINETHTILDSSTALVLGLSWCMA